MVTIAAALAYTSIAFIGGVVAGFVAAIVNNCVKELHERELTNLQERKWRAIREQEKAVEHIVEMANGFIAARKRHE